MTDQRTALKSVSQRQPCEICGGNHKCSRGADGLIVCGHPPNECPQGYKDLGPAVKDPQFRLYRHQDVPAPSHRKSAGGYFSGRAQGPAANGQKANGQARPDMDQLAREWAKALTPAPRAALADALQLPERAVCSLPLLGFSAKGVNKGYAGRACWTFPEVDAHGTIIGAICRYPDGAKKAYPGAKEA